MTHFPERSPMRRFSLLFAALAVFGPAALFAQTPDVPKETPPHPEIFEEAWRSVKKSFYDRKLHGIDWPAMREKYASRAQEAPSQRELIGVINTMLGELHASHLVCIDADVYQTHFAPEFTGKKTLRPGFEIRRHNDRWFVTAVVEDGPAAQAGLHAGDEVVRIDELPPAEHPDLLDAGSDPGISGDPHFVCRVRPDRPLHLQIRRTRDGEIAPVTVTPAMTSLVDAARSSVHVIERRGFRLGVVHLWHFLSNEMVKITAHAIRNDFADIDGLVIDIRGRGGSPFVMNAVLAMIRPPKGLWKRPVVVLTDEDSRSAKEVFSWLVKKERLGIVVGRRTAGAVLGSTFTTLSDGSALLLPVMNVRGLTDGENLEGIGVDPDVRVDEPYEYQDGRDPVMERGLDVLRQACLIEKSA